MSGMSAEPLNAVTWSRPAGEKFEKANSYAAGLLLGIGCEHRVKAGQIRSTLGLGTRTASLAMKSHGSKMLGVVPSR